MKLTHHVVIFTSKSKLDFVLITRILFFFFLALIESLELANIEHLY